MLERNKIIRGWSYYVQRWLLRQTALNLFAGDQTNWKRSHLVLNQFSGADDSGPRNRRFRFSHVRLGTLALMKKQPAMLGKLV